MIDFHSHILPGIDDGSRDFNESINLLKEAKENGFHKIISTSHYAINTYEVPEYKRIELINNLKSEVNDIDIILGSEIFLTYNILGLLSEYKASSINNTRYILFELPLRNYFPNLRDTLNKIKENNYKLILAHPERYKLIQDDFNVLYQLRDMGVLFQSNYASILGLYGLRAKIVMKKMLKNRLTNFLGSDVHREKTIYPKIPIALNKISKIISQDYLDDLTLNNAQIILNGENL